MKIIKEGFAYVQKMDIINLVREHMLDNSSVPEAFINEVCSGQKTEMIIKADDDTFFAFDEAESISFIKGLDLVDYDSARCLSIGELKKQIQEIVTEKNSIASTYNLLSAGEQHQRIDLLKRYKTLERKGRSLMDIYWAKCGKGKIVVPDGVEKIDVGNAGAIKSLIKKLF